MCLANASFLRSALVFAGVRYGRESGWRALFGNIINNYQYWFILIVIIIVTALTVVFGEYDYHETPKNLETVLHHVLCALVHNTHLIFSVRLAGNVLFPHITRGNLVKF